MTATLTGTRTLWFVDNIVRVHLDGVATGGGFDLVEAEARRGDMPPLHVHHDADETFYILKGRMSFQLPNRSVEAGSGDVLFAPRGIPHVYRVESERARWLVIGNPAGFADFVREASDQPEHEGFPPLGREHDPVRLGEAAARYGIELLGPPGTFPS